MGKEENFRKVLRGRGTSPVKRTILEEKLTLPRFQALESSRARLSGTKSERGNNRNRPNAFRKWIRGIGGRIKKGGKS